MSSPGIVPKWSLTPQQACYFAHELTRLGTVGEFDRLSTTLFDSKVDLNPHQVEAALFAISNPLQKGVILADEVGLGKTIEAGLVLCQRWAERRRRLIIVCPAHIRKQWQTELAEKFNLPAYVLDRRAWRRACADGHTNPFDCGKIPIISYPFASRMKDELRAVPFDLIVMDEAHKLRNAYQPSRKGGQAVRWAFELRDKILLTATPLQNSLLELYGLGWVIGDHIFGDRSGFQSRYGAAGGDLAGLRARLADVCRRTLRKDCAYINYTKRQAMTHPFAQTEEEKSLHRDVMDFMSREISFAFPYRQRQLIEMVLFKTLASSPQALAATLTKMRSRLIAIRDNLAESSDDSFLDEFTADEDFDIESLAECLDDDAMEAPAGAMPQGKLLAEELAQLNSLIDRTERIQTDSKSKALLRALMVAFDRLEEIGARRKALIFTESRKTQAFLAACLEANGYAGKVVTFNGSNTHPTARQAYARFTSRHAGTDKVTGSTAVDMRSALIEEFKEHAEILLATEAAAEGVNLQFCSLVVNYDLPWNPQRVEQRIGRCHRYGQQHDVIVVNFLSQGNLADKRVQDLLQQKFSLFDGLFGASDEVLGAIEDGVDFEKRVLAILKSCRTDAQIEAAFDALQRDLEGTISQRMTEAQQLLFDHFDADVHDRMKLRQRDARSALDRVGERFWKLARWGLEGIAVFDDADLAFTLPHVPPPPAAQIETGTYRLVSTERNEDSTDPGDAHRLRLSSPLGAWLLERAKSQDLPIARLRFDASNHDRKISILQALVGRTGWLRLEKLTMESDAVEEFLLFTTVTHDGENLDQEIAQRLFDLSGLVVEDDAPIPDDATLARLCADADHLANATIHRAGEQCNERFRRIQEQINQWSEDKLKGAELDLDTIRRQLRAARRQAEMAETMQARVNAEEAVARLERHQRRQRAAIFALDDEIESQRKKLISDLKQRITNRTEREVLFTIQWEVV